MKHVVKFLLAAIIIVVAIPIGFRLAASLRETQPLAEIPTEGRLIATASGDIFVQELGPADGLPVLLAHGTAAWSGLWRETMETLAAQGYRAIAFDMPPFGYSERDAAGDYSRETQARRIHHLVEAMQIKPVLVAHSFGAAAGMEAALMRRDMFAGLIIINGAIGMGKPEGALPWPISNDMLRPYIVATTGTNPLLTRTFLRQMLYRKDQATDGIIAILQRPTTRIGSTQAFSDWVPTLLMTKPALSTDPDNYAGFLLKTVLIWGEQDTVTPPAQAEALADVIVDATLIMMPDVGHIPQVEDPEAFTNTLLKALASFTQ